MRFSALKHSLCRFLDLITKFDIDGNNVGELSFYHSGGVVICSATRRLDKVEIIDLMLTTSTSAHGVLSQTNTNAEEKSINSEN